MKIRLYAFGGKMQSGLIDVPENTTPYWDMVLHSPITVISGFSGDKIAEKPSFGARCRFEWIGKYEADSGARVYNLVDIDKV